MKENLTMLAHSFAPREVEIYGAAEGSSHRTEWRRDVKTARGPSRGRAERPR